jgi:hypothetical protein
VNTSLAIQKSVHHARNTKCCVTIVGFELHRKTNNGNTVLNIRRTVGNRAEGGEVKMFGVIRMVQTTLPF